MRRKLPRNFCKAKPNKCPVVEAASVESESARQFLKRLIALEFCDVVDGRDRDVQYGFSREKSLVTGDDHVWKSQKPCEHVAAIIRAMYFPVEFVFLLRPDCHLEAAVAA
jgi:hypothetical protein